MRDTVAIQQLNRLQNRNDFLLADARHAARCGASSATSRRRGSRSIEDVRWIDEGRAFLWVSERDGWQHVYRVPREGGDADAASRGSTPTSPTSSASTKRGGWLYFLASPEQRRRSAISIARSSTAAARPSA